MCEHRKGLQNISEKGELKCVCILVPKNLKSSLFIICIFRELLEDPPPHGSAKNRLCTTMFQGIFIQENKTQHEMGRSAPVNRVLSKGEGSGFARIYGC